MTEPHNSTHPGARPHGDTGAQGDTGPKGDQVFPPSPYETGKPVIDVMPSEHGVAVGGNDPLVWSIQDDGVRVRCEGHCDFADSYRDFPLGSPWVPGGAITHYRAEHVAYATERGI